MNLRELVAEVPARVFGDPDTSITGISSDTRSLSAGSLFVALPGQQRDGASFIGEAVARGAAAVVCRHAQDSLSVPVVVTGDPLSAFGALASAFYGYPSRQLRLVGVTGTDGKTSTTALTAAILRAAGMRAGCSTTVELHDGVAAKPNLAGFTTPQPPELQEFLARCVEAGCGAAVLEVSSHALAMRRVEGCEFDVAVFTNLAPEHLDFHGTLEQYRADKARLFDALERPRHKTGPVTGVINRDDPQGVFFAARCRRPVYYGVGPGATVAAEGVQVTAAGTDFTLVTGEARVAVQTALLGRFNVRNWLAAAAAAMACGAGPDDVARAAAEVRAVPGRMQYIDGGQPFAVYVDFAHTPQALATALETVREIHSGRVAAVFGHAGGRDLNNRGGLVAAARGCADLIVLTTDDPYHEDPAAILAEMRSAAQGLGLVEGVHFVSLLDRRQAFAHAFAWARRGDAVLLAGRGHETVIVVGSNEIEFHDPTVAEELLRGMH